MKWFLLLLALFLTGCNELPPTNHPVDDSSVKANYTIIVVHGTWNQHIVHEQYHADVVQYRDNWVIFHDKTLNRNVRVPGNRATVIGGNDPIFPYVKAE
jgi:hypothetical protein